MSDFPKIKLAEFEFDLPPEFIAKRPVTQRSASKLLFYSKGNISHHSFLDIPSLVPSESTIFINNTRVIPARLNFRRATGAKIEIFLLEPLSEEGIEVTMQSKKGCAWKCMIGNLKKWKAHEVISIKTETNTLYASLIDRKKKQVSLTWDSSEAFSAVLAEMGKVPLPPYINRDSDTTDLVRYQTVYSEIEGAVAAPTAGLHFTSSILETLKENHTIEPLTLHVGAGTFQPISTASVDQHPMHSEVIYITRKNIQKIQQSNFSIAVGTTSMRTLESIYWFGAKLERDPNADFYIEKDYPYEKGRSISLTSSMENIIRYMNNRNTDTLKGATEIFIVPGYKFRIVEGLITNYHLPGSTLILLVAAFIGGNWRDIYDQAKIHKYRFLSYGDSSFLLP